MLVSATRGRAASQQEPKDAYPLLIESLKFTAKRKRRKGKPQKKLNRKREVGRF